MALFYRQTRFGPRGLGRIFATLALSAGLLTGAGLLATQSGGAQALAQDRAAGQQLANLSQDQRETVARVENYLNDIRTVQARFVQTSSNGAVAQGDLYLSRPGRLRFEYDEPHPSLIVANYGQLLYIDRELRETTYLPLRETPVWFLVRSDIDLIGEADIEVAEVTQGSGTVEVTVVQPGGRPGQPGSLTLVFADQPLELKKWSLVDQQNVTTEIAIQQARFGQPISASVFDFGELDIPRVEPGPRRLDDGS